MSNDFYLNSDFDGDDQNPKKEEPDVNDDEKEEDAPSAPDAPDADDDIVDDDDEV